jgi:D-arabinose 1-dehydrogenase-like Zn-dependent alcohol dehydrogenase
MRSSKSRDVKEYNGHELYLKTKQGIDINQLEPIQELMFNIVWNFTGEQKSGRTYQQYYKPKATLDMAKQHTELFGINKITKPMLWNALDELKELGWLKMVRKETVDVVDQWKKEEVKKTYYHWQVTDDAETIVKRLKQQAKHKTTTQPNSLF